MKFPTTFCISLKVAEDRRKKVTQHLKDRAINFNLFDAIHASKMGLKTRYAYLDDKLNWQPEDGPPYKISQGVLGCSMSHYTLWRIMQYIDDDAFLVLEDDVELCDGFKEKLIERMAALPADWQFVFVGHCCMDSNHIMVKDGIAYTPVAPMCTHAYLVRKSALQHLIDTNDMMYAPIDIQLKKRSMPSMIHYSLIPPLAIQNGDASTYTYCDK